MNISGKISHEGLDYPIYYCPLCEAHILLCPKCGNNACNGGYGEIDGVECDACPGTYDVQDAHGKFLAALDK